MKRKKLLSLLIVLIVGVVSAINVNIAIPEKGLSDFELANVEALAAEPIGTSSDAVITCGSSGGACWKKRGTICFIGSYTYDRCQFDGSQLLSCPNRCGDPMR